VRPEAVAGQLLAEGGPLSPLDGGVRPRSKQQVDLPVADVATALLNLVRPARSFACARPERVVGLARRHSAVGFSAHGVATWLQLQRCWIRHAPAVEDTVGHTMWTIRYSCFLRT